MAWTALPRRSGLALRPLVVADRKITSARSALMILGLLAALGCAHPAERALQGRWQGQAVENFDQEEVAAATGWARGTQFEFEGKRLTVSVPAEEPRTGTYRLVAIENRRVTLAVRGKDGRQSELQLIVDDAKNLRWVLEEGRTLLLEKR